MKKTCRKCGEVVSSSEFNKRRNVCKKCFYTNEIYLEANRTFPTSGFTDFEEYLKLLYIKYEFRFMKLENPEEYQKQLKIRRLNRHYAQYNLTHQDVQQQGEFQNWCCCICEVDINNRFHVDHDHLTGEFRGLLCFKCNVGLGNFGDSIELLNQAILYLNRYN